MSQENEKELPPATERVSEVIDTLLDEEYSYEEILVSFAVHIRSGMKFLREEIPDLHDELLEVLKEALTETLESSNAVTEDAN